MTKQNNREQPPVSASPAEPPEEFDPPCNCAIRKSRLKQGVIGPHHASSCPQYGGVRPENEPQRMARRTPAASPEAVDCCPDCGSHVTFELNAIGKQRDGRSIYCNNSDFHSLPEPPEFPQINLTPGTTHKRLKPEECRHLAIKPTIIFEYIDGPNRQGWMCLDCGTEFKIVTPAASHVAVPNNLKQCVKEGPDCDCKHVCKFDAGIPVAVDSAPPR